MKKKDFYSLGIMSGTSIDGFDFSLMKTDGINNIEVIHNKYYKFSNQFKDKIKNCIEEINSIKNSNYINNHYFKKKNLEFTEFLSAKINHFFSEVSFPLSKLDLIGIHGNTLLHIPQKKQSIQLGEAKNCLNISKLKLFMILE